MTTIQSGPPADGTSTDRTATFSFSAAETAGQNDEVTYKCSLDGAAFAACTSPVDYSNLALGEHTFEVEATNLRYSFVEETPASRTWTIELPPDTTAPETTLDSAPDATSASAQATFRFSGSDAVSPAAELTFQCSLDGGDFESCTSPHVIGDLTAGGHTFAVQAVDGSGNVDQSAATHAWTVVAPETTIVSGPQATTATATATFHFTSSDSTATFECSLDGGTTWSGCDPVHAGREPRPGYVRAARGRGEHRRRGRPDAGQLPVDGRRARHDGRVRPAGLAP